MESVHLSVLRRFVLVSDISLWLVSIVVGFVCLFVMVRVGIACFTGGYVVGEFRCLFILWRLGGWGVLVFVSFVASRWLESFGVCFFCGVSVVGEFWCLFLLWRLGGYFVICRADYINKRVQTTLIAGGEGMGHRNLTFLNCRVRNPQQHPEKRFKVVNPIRPTSPK